MSLEDYGRFFVEFMFSTFPVVVMLSVGQKFTHVYNVNLKTNKFGSF